MTEKKKSSATQKKIYVKEHVSKIWSRLSEAKKNEINKKTRRFFEKLVTKSTEKKIEPGEKHE